MARTAKGGCVIGLLGVPPLDGTAHGCRLATAHAESGERFACRIAPLRSSATLTSTATIDHGAPLVACSTERGGAPVVKSKLICYAVCHCGLRWEDGPAAVQAFIERQDSSWDELETLSPAAFDAR